MYTINVNKFQQLPRGEDGRASTGAKRKRLPETAFEVKPSRGRGAWLRPTKGWFSRNLRRMLDHGELVQHLDVLKARAVHHMLVAREERNKQKSKPE